MTADDTAMQPLDAALARIAAAPDGPGVAAMFDFDGTIVHGYSGVHFFRDRLTAGKVGPRELLGTAVNGLRGTDSEAEFERFVAVAFRAWAGHTEDELQQVGRGVFENTLAGLVYPEAWRLIEAHKRKGHTLVIASSASRYQFEAAAEALGVDHLLFTPLEVVDGVLTGKVDGASLWRSGKARAARAFATAHDIDTAASFTYSNGGEDVEFLATTGHPTAVNPDKNLTRAADERGWPVLRFRPRGAYNVKDLARTAVSLGTLAGSVGTGVGLGLLNLDRRLGIDAVSAIAPETMLATAGVRVDIHGEDNAWKSRPAVFIFNHQSFLDTVLIARVLREGFTGVTKKEMATNPLFGLPLRIAGATFVDRQNTDKAKEALRPVVDTLRSGTSLVVSPEGTRSLTPSIGRFKKGAFHIAIQAGVPVVPIVIRNAGELMAKGAKLVRSGTVDIAVLPPIDVSEWDPADLQPHIDAVETLYRDTLNDWPRG
ncbi:HAD-IB family hydrolase [Tomitella gaofuii]|uniref:HAD-IB family hydrolase n=1 Tax=Tomitella gaofuii TaxID=2760083 RepID=UPI001F45A535|nr:HAD-IB family hydrolase [Tomitella gaofuii]